MKNRKPIFFLTVGSVIVYGFTLITLLFLFFLLNDFPFWVVLFVPFLIAGFTYIIFYYFITVFLNDRLKIIYRSIRKGKTTKNNSTSVKLSDDVITNIELESQKWTEDKNLEISRLKEQEEFRREFLGNLAHELKTPVFSIQGYILTLLDGAIDDEKVNKVFLERASKATDRMAGILEDLDQITQLEVENLKLEMRSFDVHELTEEVFDSFEMIAKEKNIVLKFGKDNFSAVHVVGDRSKIGQVLTNLVGNAIFYGNVGGEVVARFYVLDELVTVEISDNGPGIEDTFIGRIFERFYRVEKSRNRNEGGSGLGLAIVKHIIESHGQTISVRSTVGLGSTFSFSLDKSTAGSNILYSSRGIPIN